MKFHIQINLLTHFICSVHAVISLLITIIGAFLAFYWISDTECEEYFLILYIRCIYWALTFVSNEIICKLIFFILFIFSSKIMFLLFYFQFQLRTDLRSRNQISTWTTANVWLSWILSSNANSQGYSIAYCLAMEYGDFMYSNNYATPIW